MKRILTLMTALMLVVGVAGNAAATMEYYQFGLVTMGQTLETADSFGGDDDGDYIWSIDDLAGTRLDNIWTIDQFGGDTYADLKIIAVGGEAWNADYTQTIFYAGILQGQTPTFRDSSFGGWSSSLLNATAKHQSADFVNTIPNGAFQQSMGYDSLGGFVTSRNAMYASIGDILTSDYVLDIWAYDSLSGEEWNTGLSVRMFAEGGTINAEINAVPIPGALMLLGSGLLALVGIRRKRA